MTDDPRSPLELLEALTVQEVEISPGLRHLEIYTMRGLLTLLWHGPTDADRVLVTVRRRDGQPARPRRRRSTTTSACTLAEQGIGTIRVGYRKPNDLSRCVHDMAADRRSRRAGAARAASW